ncbi:MAG TPA: hypothetical protein VMX77_00860 [Candidatus Bathyarchaeia archaeon]|nr:hypothetical protein [Candidatus Bathyarchaeia archaeon]
MRKEVLIAILIGFGLGLVITFGIWTANKALQEAPAEEAAPTPEAEVSSTPAFSLTIDQPENNSISAEEEIAVSGSSVPEAVIVVLYDEGEKILEADENGLFETQITLAGGDNEIEISAYDNEGNETSQTLTVVYSTAEI